VVIINLIYFAISCALLVASGIYLTKSMAKIARFLGIPEFSVAFIIMAFATSIPELFIGVSSAFYGNPELSLGNILGANILNLTLISGIIILVSKEIKMHPLKTEKDSYMMLFAVILLTGLYILGETLSRIDGIILLAFFSINTYSIFKKRKKYSKKINNTEKQYKFYWLLVFLISLVLLFISANLAVRYATGLAMDLNIPQIVIGLFLLSIATTLPELTFGVSAVALKHESMAIGDQIGTIITNSTLILGIVALINPITSELVPFMIAALFMIVSAFVFIKFIKTGHKLERMEGIILILIYILFIILEIFLKGAIS
jgi:cation:H+ antiporter